MVTYEQFNVVVVPFPFTDVPVAKKRPAVIISDASFNRPLKKYAMAMVTTTGHSPWPLDTPILNLKSAGLKAPSLIRLKLFTLDENLIIRKMALLNVLLINQELELV